MCIVYIVRLNENFSQYKNVTMLKYLRTFDFSVAYHIYNFSYDLNLCKYFSFCFFFILYNILFEILCNHINVPISHHTNKV